MSFTVFVDEELKSEGETSVEQEIRLNEQLKNIERDFQDETVGFIQSDIEELATFAQKYNLKLVGCDLPRSERSPNYWEKKVNNRREHEMGRIILKYISKSNQPIIALFVAFLEVNLDSLPKKAILNPNKT